MSFTSNRDFVVEIVYESSELLYELLEMKNRVNNNLPEVSLVDMKEEFKKGNTILSKKLYDNIFNE